MVGPAAAWAEVVPPEISVYPKQDGTAAVILSPPSDGSALGGLVPFGILVCSTVDANASAVAEADLEIGELLGLQAKIVPVNSTGRWRGRHVVQLSNWGNSPAQLKLVARDPDEALGFTSARRTSIFLRAARRPCDCRSGPSARSCAGPRYASRSR